MYPLRENASSHLHLVCDHIAATLPNVCLCTRAELQRGAARSTNCFIGFLQHVHVNLDEILLRQLYVTSRVSVASIGSVVSTDGRR